ncbi:MAG: MBL fold metallo-hydrolase [Chloroflexi bacterium]|nr:MBL fold metallo-hydrolase [Chloroflexota bacterium]
MKSAASAGQVPSGTCQRQPGTSVPGSYTQLAPNLFIHHGAINVGILRNGDRALLIDCADDLAPTLAALGIRRVERILFTHHHRDQTGGAEALAAAGALLGVPAAERAWFEGAGAFWQEPRYRWHLYDERPGLLVLARPLTVLAAHGEGDTLAFGQAAITALETPGHTDGSLSYLVALPDGQRFAFTGDLIYGPGQLWDLYSLQKGWTTHDYHGYLGDRPRLLESLARVVAAGPGALVPAHGALMPDPAGAVALLRERLEAAYHRYAAISALRHYFPPMFAAYEGTPGMMPFAPAQPIPDFLAHIGTSWLIRSAEGPCWLVDGGSDKTLGEIQQRQAARELGPVEGLWISHYHDDHVDAIPRFQEALGCPVLADEAVAQVVERPLEWRLPCISPSAVRVDRRLAHGESWRWREFTLTSYHLPGQTLYHGGLLVEGRGRRLFFCGDSFTPAGIDDYCMGNRNPLGEGVGFDACLRLVGELAPDLLFNCHVGVGWAFSGEQIAFMRANLAAREAAYAEMSPWDHPNQALDPHWVRCAPYEQTARPGETVRIEVVVANDDARPHRVAARLVPPPGWAGDAGEIVVGPRAESRLPLTLAIPPDAPPGRYPVPVDLAWDDTRLPQFREAMVGLVTS